MGKDGSGCECGKGGNGNEKCDGNGGCGKHDHGEKRGPCPARVGEKLRDGVLAEEAKTGKDPKSNVGIGDMPAKKKLVV